MNEQVTLAVSSCLLGENVRYNGNNSLNNYIIGSLARNLDIVSVCPENLIGLGTPRPPIQLVLSGNNIHSLGVANNELDVTEKLKHCAQIFLDQHPGICGFILKSKSPSCGVLTTRLYDLRGALIHNQATGIFAEELTNNAWYIPVTCEDRLATVQARVEFLTKVYAVARLNRAINSHDPINSLRSLQAGYAAFFDTISPVEALKLAKYIQDKGLQKNQMAFISGFKTIYCNLILSTISRSQFSQFFKPLATRISNYLDGSMTLDVKNTISSYENGKIEWPELISVIDSATVNNKCGSCPAVSYKNVLFPLSILGD